MKITYVNGKLSDLGTLAQIQKRTGFVNGFAVEIPTYRQMWQARLVIMKVDGSIAGFGVVRRLGIENAEISHIGILGPQRHNGLGKKLEAKLKSVARDGFGCKTLFAVPGKIRMAKRQTQRAAEDIRKEFFAEAGYRPQEGGQVWMKNLRKRGGRAR